MAPLTPHWTQPSHSSIQTVIPSSPSDFTTKSLSKVTLAPYALFAKLSFPPCTKAEKATYATVQMGADEHLSLNSDLVYINHSCEPSLTFDMNALAIFAGPNGLKAGDELTFFYPSTEWDMAQGFDCFCGTRNCKGYIAGAKSMRGEQLEGMWLNAHIRALLAERDNKSATDDTESALRAALEQARKTVDAAQRALDTYKSLHLVNGASNGAAAANGKENGDEKRRGVTNREMSGEMGGDTKSV